VLDSLVCGVGWLRARINPDLTSEPIKLESLRPEEVVYDYKSKALDLSDARYVAVVRLVPESEAREVFGRFESGVAVDLLNPQDYAWLDSEGLVSVVEGEYKTWKRTQVVWDGVQAEVYVPTLHDRLIQQGLLRVEEMPVPVIRSFTIVGNTVVRDEDTPFSTYSFFPVMFHRKVDGTPMGMVDLLYDLQLEINKRRSKALQYLESVRVLAEEGAVKEPSQLLQELEKTVSFIEWRPEFKLQIERDLDLSLTHYKYLEGAINELTLISGISPDLMGVPTNARTGTALQMRVLQALSGLVHLLLKIENAMRNLSYRAFNIARILYTDTRFMELTDLAIGNLGLFSQDIDLVNLRSKLVSGRFDLIVKIGSEGMTGRQEHLVHLVELLKVLPPESLLILFDIIIDAFDLPEKAEIKRRLALLIASMTNKGGQNADTDTRPKSA